MEFSKKKKDGLLILLFMFKQLKVQNQNHYWKHLLENVITNTCFEPYFA